MTGPAAQLTVPGYFHNIPVTQPDPNAGLPDVTFLNSHAQIELPVAVTETGQTVILRFTNPEDIGWLVSRAVLAQGRLARVVWPNGHAA